jgi:hypothetical protein
MWTQLAVATGIIVVIVALLVRAMRRRPRRIDVGPVSDAWLAEHRARGRDVH